MRAYCCFVPDENQAALLAISDDDPQRHDVARALACQAFAAWDIYDEEDRRPDAGTQSCAAHVGAMLNPGHAYRIVPIEPQS